MLVFIAKYDIGIFYLEENQTLPIRVFPKTEEGIRENETSLINLTEIPDNTKGECLARFLRIIPRLKNPYEFILKVNSTKLIDKLFPTLSRTLNDENFLIFLKRETERSEEEKQLNNDIEIFNFIYLYSKNTKPQLLKEFRILENARGTKKSDVIIRLNQLNLNFKR